MENVIVALILLAIAGAAVLYLIRVKKNGGGCVGCPSSKKCSGKCSECCGCEDKDKKNGEE